MKLELVRHAYLDTHTAGSLIVHDEARSVFATMERPWLENPNGPGGMRSRSCVPDGVYSVRPHDSQKFPNTFALEAHALGVYYQSLPEGQTFGRTAILIHVGNTVKDVIGCVALGMSHGVLGNNEAAVMRSRTAMNLLRGMLGNEGRHELVIRPTRGTEETL